MRFRVVSLQASYLTRYRTLSPVEQGFSPVQKSHPNTKKCLGGQDVSHWGGVPSGRPLNIWGVSLPGKREKTG